ncbi:glycosyltransferase [uncultured Chryseobacterium sp.]|uniref:glycosyltransferase n=1 Tax=uncultured Chryseobacterium sp. TaxID=259322 RepID=UPI0025EECA22|nr:glycosyltransferase [uncultured Chryseobacterium sp.]
MDCAKYVKLSILVPTIGRVQELEDLLLSIQEANIEFSFEIIIIDQNNSNQLDDIISCFSSILPLKYHKVTFKGLSKAKNYGARVASGEFVSFPDDDCKIFQNTYSAAFASLERENADMVFGKCVDEKGNDTVLNFKKTAYNLTKDNMLGGFVEATVVCRRSIFDKFQFDENMGAGTFFGAEEGFDWMYRILTHSSIKAYFNPKILFYHPNVILEKGDEASLNRVFKYSCGTGYLCKKHNFTIKFFKRLTLVRLAIVIYYFYSKEKYYYYSAEFLGLKTGYLFSNFYKK